MPVIGPLDRQLVSSDSNMMLPLTVVPSMLSAILSVMVPVEFSSVLVKVPLYNPVRLIGSGETVVPLLQAAMVKAITRARRTELDFFIIVINFNGNSG